jgi:hypothetical protein
MPQGLDLVRAVDKLIEWGNAVDKRLKRIESTVARLESQVRICTVGCGDELDLEGAPFIRYYALRSAP